MPAILATTTLCGLLILPKLGSAQTSGGPRLDSGRQEVFQSLTDSQWVRLSGSGLVPLRVSATSIDTVWTRGHSALLGGVVGGLFLGVLGAVVGGTAGEPGGDDYNPGAWALILGGGGLVGGGILGAVIGAAIPKWHRQFP